MLESIRRNFESVSPKYIEWDFYSQYIDREPPFGQLGLPVFIRTYSRYLPTEHRREKWCEVVLRVVEYSLSLDTVTTTYEKKIEARLMFDDLYNMRSLPAGRTLWVANTPIVEKDGSANFNCTARTVHELSSLVEGFYLLLVGAGFGFSVEKKYTNQLPPFFKGKTIVHKPYEYNKYADIENTYLTNLVWSGCGDGQCKLDPVEGTLNFRLEIEKGDNEFADDYKFGKTFSTRIEVGDSKEGWVMALKSYLAALTSPSVKVIEIDYNNVRPEGSLLKTFGGRSSGPQALQTMFETIAKVVEESNEVGQQLRPVQVMDIANCIGLAVVVGGVRRSSELCLADIDDDEIRNAKKDLWTDPTLIDKRTTRVMSNNSLALYENPGLKWFEDVMEAIRTTGEPGFISVGNANKKDPSNTRKVFNPCFAAGTMVVTRKGDYPIEDLVGKTVEVFDGNDWVKINNFRVTGENQEVWKLTLDDVYSVVATPYHTFITNTGERKQLKELQVWDELKVVHGGISAKITSIEYFGVVDKVYCCTVPTNNSFTLSYGLLVGQCAEICLDDRGVCNLSEVYLPRHITENRVPNYDSLKLSLTIATRIGMRMTLVKMFHSGWDYIQNRDRLLGVSLSGIVDFFDALNMPQKEMVTFLQWCRKQVHETAEVYANRLGVNIPLLMTTVKPSGTLSTLVGCGSGVHRLYAPYYLRRIRVSVNDPIALALKDMGIPVNPENGQGEHIHDDGVNTWVFTFGVKSDTPIKAIDESALIQMERYKLVLNNYVDHNVSFTCSVAEDEWMDVAQWLYENYDSFIGVSFLPKFDSTNSPYPQLPYEACDEATYNELVRNQPTLSENEFLTVLSGYEKGELYDLLDSDCGASGCPIR
jgi:ribonucleotide reductase alpha subunit